VGVLNAKQRAASAVIKPRGAPPSGDKFPIPDKAHARAALARIDQAKPALTPTQKAEVRARAKAVLKGKGK
jgi:hypothetical protein